MIIGGVERKAHCFILDLPHSDGCFVKAYPAETTGAFLGGVPRSILYGNTKLAVAKILGAGRRQCPRAFTGLQSHYLFDDRFGRPGKGNGKGKPESTERRAPGQRPEAARRRSCASGIMVCNSNPAPEQGAPIDAATPPPRPGPNHLRRPPPGGQRRADPSGHPRPAPWPAPTTPEAPRPGRCAGPGQHRRQADDAGGLRSGRRRLHRRHRCAARRRDRPRSRFHGQGSLHPGRLPAQLPVGPCPPTGPGEPGVAGPGPGGWGRTRRQSVDHRPGLHQLRDLRSGQGGRPPVPARR